MHSVWFRDCFHIVTGSDEATQSPKAYVDSVRFREHWITSHFNVKQRDVPTVSTRGTVEAPEESTTNKDTVWPQWHLPTLPNGSPSLPGSEFVCNLLCHCI